MFGDRQDIVDANGTVVGSREADYVAAGWFIDKPISAIWDYKVTGIWQKDEVEEAKKRVGKYDHTTMDDIEAYIGDDEHKEWKDEFDKLFGEKIPSKTNATKSVRKVKFAVIRKWFVEKREGEEAEKAKKAREAAAKKAKRTNKKATDEDKAVEQNVPLEVANNSQQEQLDLVS